MGNLTTPPSVQKLQSALHAKAKEEPGYRFYLLYDKVYRADVLEYAYRCCKANKGAAGVDGQRFEDIEAYGEDRWLGELANRLRTKDLRAASGQAGLDTQAEQQEDTTLALMPCEIATLATDAPQRRTPPTLAPAALLGTRRTVHCVERTHSRPEAEGAFGVADQPGNR